jgi:DTW domain-containing protein YfiP
METVAQTKRAVCARCSRPLNACICQWIRHLDTEAEVVILQHPLELNQAKGSARLLHLSLNRSQLHVGEQFDQAFLHQLLFESGKTSILLYPKWSSDQPSGVLAPPELNPECLESSTQLRLIVLDGTWRKSRKMLYLNPLLQALPRFVLNDMPASHYRIRKAHKPDQLSTLEACCYALMQLEKNKEKCLPLLSAFDGFIGQIIGQGQERDAF